MYSDVSDCILSLMIPDTEPTSQRIPSFAEILVELSSRENIFYRHEFGTSRADFEKITVDGFWEVGEKPAISTAIRLLAMFTFLDIYSCALRKPKGPAFHYFAALSRWLEGRLPSGYYRPDR